jgi:hypothetical protein
MPDLEDFEIFDQIIWICAYSPVLGNDLIWMALTNLSGSIGSSQFGVTKFVNQVTGNGTKLDPTAKKRSFGQGEEENCTDGGIFPVP